MINVSKPVMTNDQEEWDEITEVLLSGKYVSGKYVERFESFFSNYINSSYLNKIVADSPKSSYINYINKSAAVNSGTSALFLSLCNTISPGDEVIVPSLTFFSTISSVIMTGGIPVFADINDDYNIDVESIKENITDKTKAIIPVHYLGYPCDLKEINELISGKDIYLIEDAAQAHGAGYEGFKIGNIFYSDYVCFSFFATKNIHTGGEGGMIVSTPNNIEKIKILRSHGMTDRHTHSFLGYNMRMTELESVIGYHQLKYLDTWNTVRDLNSRFLLENLRKYNWLTIQKFENENKKHAWFWCPILLNEKIDVNYFLDFLNKNEIGYRYRYTEPLYKQPIFNGKYKNLYLPNAERIAGNLVGLPNHPFLKEEELFEILNVMEKFDRKV